MGGAKRKKSVGTFLCHGIVRNCRVRVRVRVKEGEELRIEGQKMREDLWGYMPFSTVFAAQTPNVSLNKIIEEKIIDQKKQMIP